MEHCRGREERSKSSKRAHKTLTKHGRGTAQKSKNLLDNMFNIEFVLSGMIGCKSWVLILNISADKVKVVAAFPFCESSSFIVFQADYFSKYAHDNLI